jgi:hypothetical protein
MGEATEGRTKGNKSVDSLTLDHAASHLAVAMTISILLRSIPHHAAKRINVIPTEIGKSLLLPSSLEFVLMEDRRE